MKNAFSRLPVLFLPLLMLTSMREANAQEGQPALYAQTSEVNNIMVRYYADHGSLERSYFVSSSPERREKLRSIVTVYLKKLDDLTFESLNTGSRVDYILFRRDLRE